MNDLKIFFSFNGRINRAKFWAGKVIVAFAFALVFIAQGGGDSYITLGRSAIIFLTAIISIWMWLALYVKRWHDRNKSGGMVFVFLIPVIGPLWTFFELGFLEGTIGPNDYGEDPILLREPTQDSNEHAAWDLLSKGNRLEKNGDPAGAAAQYEQILKTLSNTEAAKDAAVCLRVLKEKISDAPR